jgi:hypothetical protein
MLGELHAAQGEYARAEAALRRSLAIRLKIFGADNFFVAQVSARLAAAVAAQNSFTEARTLFAASLPIQERVLGPNAPEVLSLLDQFAKVLRKLKDIPQAEMIESRAKDIRADLTYTIPVSRLRN